MRSTNIFNRIVKNEDTLTELLVNLLAFDVFRKAFISFLRKEANNLPQDFDFQFSHVDTQYSCGESGRPDIVIDSLSCLLLIENKIEHYTTLTQNQKNGYIDIFTKSEHEKKVKFLFFLIPQTYLHEGNIKNITNHLTDQESNINLRIIYWEELLILLKREISGNIPEFIIINQFIELGLSWFKYQKIKFSNTEINMLKDKDFAVSFRKLMKIIHNLENILGRNQYKVKRKVDDEDYGLIISDKDGLELLYIGIWYSLWEEYGIPICIAVKDDYKNHANFKKICESVDITEEKKLNDWPNWVAFDISDKLESVDDSSKSVYGKIENILKELQA